MQKLIYFFGCVCALFLTEVSAQKHDSPWSLESCIDYAYKNNLTVKRQQLNTIYESNQLKQSKRNRLPNLNGEVNGSLNYGYTWIQQEAQNVDLNTRSISTGVSSSLSLFQGLNKKKTIEQQEFNLLASVQDVEELKNDIALLITAQFLQILLDQELLTVANSQYEITQLQIERVELLVEAGSVPFGDLLELKSQLAKESLTITQQENNLSISKLNLAQFLDIEDSRNFEVEVPIIPSIDAMKLSKSGTIYQAALKVMPEIKGSEFRVNSSEVGVGIAKSGLYPTLNLGFSMTANANFLSEDPNGLNRSLFDQLESTRNTYLGLSMQIPIFNKLQSRTNIENARLSLEDAKFQLQIEKLSLQKDVEQASVDATNSYKKMISSEKTVDAFVESLRYTQKKFEVGSANSVDLSVAKGDYIRAKSDLIQAKYQFLLRTKILDLYQGLPIEL